MKASEILINAKALIKNPDNWTQHVYARTGSGDKTSYYDPKATCFCSLGAIRKVGDDDNTRIEACRFLLDQMNGHIPSFNDSGTHGQVMEAFDNAIKCSIEDERARNV